MNYSNNLAKLKLLIFKIKLKGLFKLNILNILSQIMGEQGVNFKLNAIEVFKITKKWWEIQNLK